MHIDSKAINAAALALCNDDRNNVDLFPLDSLAELPVESRRLYKRRAKVVIKAARDYALTKMLEEGR